MHTTEVENDVVCIILVNYNGWQDTIECLESLLKLNYDSYYIIVVDNASTDNSIQNINSWACGDLSYNFSSNLISKKVAFPPSPKPIKITGLNTENLTSLKNDTIEKITVISSYANVGFAGGNNIATSFSMSFIKPKYFWYLNNDTIVDKNSLKELINCFREQKLGEEIYGLVGSKLMYYHQPDVIQAMGATYNPWVGSVKHIGGNEIDRGQYNIVKETSLDYIVGASMLVSRTFIEEVGLMSIDYFLYFEELDWVNRGKRQGFTFKVAPMSVVYHKEGSSTGGNSRNKAVSFISDYYNKRNILKITKKFYPFYLPIIYASLIIVILNRVRKKQFNRIKPFIKLFFSTKDYLNKENQSLGE